MHFGKLTNYLLGGNQFEEIIIGHCYDNTIYYNALLYWTFCEFDYHKSFLFNFILYINYFICNKYFVIYYLNDNIHRNA